MAEFGDLGAVRCEFCCRCHTEDNSDVSVLYGAMDPFTLFWIEVASLLTLLGCPGGGGPCIGVQWVF